MIGEHCGTAECFAVMLLACLISVIYAGSYVILRDYHYISDRTAYLCIMDDDDYIPLNLFFSI